MFAFFFFFFTENQCHGNKRTCVQQQEGIPEFTWSIVAAGDLQQEMNGRSEKKTGSPQGWEEGKTEGITTPLVGESSYFIIQVRHSLHCFS